MRTTSFLACFSSVCSALVLRQTVPEVDYSNFTFALVRAPPAYYPYPPPSNDWHGKKHDLSASIDLGIQYIQRAALEGANFVAFPELWFPG
jgi:hypothetical protein